MAYLPRYVLFEGDILQITDIFPNRIYKKTPMKLIRHYLLRTTNSCYHTWIVCSAYTLHATVLHTYSAHYMWANIHYKSNYQTFSVWLPFLLVAVLQSLLMQEQNVTIKLVLYTWAGKSHICDFCLLMCIVPFKVICSYSQTHAWTRTHTHLIINKQ